MSYIAVPNDFFRDVFKNSGVTVPIKVIRAGIDTEKYPYYERPERDVFTFGICGYLNERKGAFELIQAFASEFSPDEPVRLKLHTTNHAFRYYKNFSDPRIELSWDYKDFSQLNEFYRSLDCFVFPSKAEGVGYPPREAMSTGLPTIVTEYSGLYDIARAGWAYPLSNLTFQKRKDMTDQPGNWAVIDTSELMYWMRHVYEHRNEAKRKGKTASEYIHKFHSWEYCAKKLKDFLEVI
jgi:glycosyltransferase involved in cell wall biosynthesis